MGTHTWRLVLSRGTAARGMQMQPDLSVLAAGALGGALTGLEEDNGRGTKRGREGAGVTKLSQVQEGQTMAVASAMADAMPSPEDDEDLEGLDEEEKRKVIRQKRNRLSAQLSRDRKKNYVSELEQKVQKLIGQNAQLTTCCKKLLQENRELRTAVAIYRGTSLQALGASAGIGG